MPQQEPQAGTQSAGLPKLRDDLRLYEDGPASWTLFDPVSDRYFKLDAADHELLSRLDRRQTIEELGERSGRDKDSLLKVLAFLGANGLLESSYGADADLDSRREALKGAALSKWLVHSYLFLDIPLLRPDRLLERCAPPVLKLFNRWTLWTLALTALCGYVSLLPNAERVATAFWASLDFEGLLGYALALVAIKIVHEFAHAFAAKALGIRVRKMGVAFIVFIPRLYTDITDAWRIPDRSKRAVIDGAGILAELIIGGFAAIVWSNAAPGGAISSIAYYVFAIGAINTVFINGNPFIKYDGYYLLMDLIGVDNLYMRGVELARASLRSRLLGMEAPPEPESLRLKGWRRPFMACFAVASIAYRIFLYTSIILIVYLQFTKALGMALFALEAYLMLLRPAMAELKDVMRHRSSIDAKRAWISATAAAALALLLLAPLPWRISMQCELRPASLEALCAKEDGMLLSIDVADGAPAKAGQTVFAQENPFIDWAIRQKSLEAKAAELEIDQASSNRKRINELGSLTKRLEGARGACAEIVRRKGNLQVKAGQDGVAVFFNPHLKPGKWLSAGEPIGELFSTSAVEAIAFAEESDVGSLRAGDSARLLLPGTMKTWKAKVIAVNEVPAKDFVTLSPLLDVAGGSLRTVVSPEERSMRLAKPLYAVRLALPDGAGAPPGRTGVAQVWTFHSPVLELLRLVLSTLQRELAF